MKKAARIISVIEFGSALTLFILGIVFLSIHAQYGGLFLGFGIYGMIGNTLCGFALHGDSKKFAIIAAIINIAFSLVLSILMFKIPYYQYTRAVWIYDDKYIGKRIKLPRKIGLFTLAGLGIVVAQTILVYPTIPQVCKEPLCTVVRDPFGRECILVRCVFLTKEFTLPSKHLNTPITKTIDSFCENVNNSKLGFTINYPDSFKEIAAKSFKMATDFEKINLPDSIEVICKETFYGTSITEINLGESLKKIETQAFRNCDKLQSLSFKDNLESIGDMAFYSCKGLRNVYITDSISHVGENAFGANPDLTIFTSFKETPEGWAENWAGDTKVVQVGGEFTCTLTDTEAWIDSYFGDDEEVRIPSYIDGKPVAQITGESFLDKTSVKKVILPDTVKRIGQGAFTNCTSLESINFPNSLTYIANLAFKNTGFTNIEIPNTVTLLGNGVFSECKNLVNATINAKIEKLPVSTFKNCSKIEKVNLCDNIHAFGSRVFEGTSIKELKIPRTIDTLDANALYNMPELEYVYIPKEVINVSAGIVTETKFLKKIYCEHFSRPFSWDGNWNAGIIDSKISWGYNFSNVY